MSEALDERYLTWLYSQVASIRTRNRARSFWKLLAQLHDTEFVWFIPNDDNRVQDGRALRDEFLAGEAAPADWLDEGCSMLEMLIALSRDIAFQVEARPEVWFWHLIEVLDLEQFNDKEYDDHAHSMIEEALDRVIFRNYASNGQGGLFPLRNPREDQREVELWYQLSAYLLEQF